MNNPEEAHLSSLIQEVNLELTRLLKILKKERLNYLSTRMLPTWVPYRKELISYLKKTKKILQDIEKEYKDLYL